MPRTEQTMQLKITTTIQESGEQWFGTVNAEQSDARCAPAVSPVPRFRVSS